jgi:hypothetical protein
MGDWNESDHPRASNGEFGDGGPKAQEVHANMDRQSQFVHAKAMKEKIDSEVARASAEINRFPKDGPFGMASDATRATPEWKQAKGAYDKAFARQRAFNEKYTKHFASELKAERMARNAARGR